MENLTISLSYRFKDILNRIYHTGDNVSKFILNLENNQDFVYSFSFLDITDSEDQISFIQVNKYKQITEQDHGPRTNINEILWSSNYRNDMRIGRLIIRLAPFFKQQEIEKFVNLYKAEYKHSLKNVKFKIVEGDDIIKYYSGKSYARGSGSLNKSCMRHDPCSQFMDLYRVNPDKIKMVILFNGSKESISGRALLWKLDIPKDTWLMDRIYTCEDSDTILFKKYADKNGWLYKSTQSFDCVKVMKDGVETFIDMKVNIGGKFRYFPYIDTLLYYNKKDNYLTNDENDYNNNIDIIKLREITGTDSGNENFVYDILNDSNINVMDSIYCYYGDGYTHKNNAFFMKDNDEYCYPDNLKYSTWHKKFVLNNNSVYSYALESFLLMDSVNKVYLAIDDSCFDYLLKKHNGTDHARHMNGNHYDITLLIKGIDGRYYFKDEYDEKKILDLINKDRKDLDEVIKNSDYIRGILEINDKKKKNYNFAGFDPVMSKSKKPSKSKILPSIGKSAVPNHQGDLRYPNSFFTSNVSDFTTTLWDTVSPSSNSGNWTAAYPILTAVQGSATTEVITTDTNDFIETTSDVATDQVLTSDANGVGTWDIEEVFYDNSHKNTENNDDQDISLSDRLRKIIGKKRK